MSQLGEIDDFYEAGRKLSEYIAYSKGKQISTATLQALIRDFLPQHEELQEALRSIVTRPGFLQLMQLANSGKGVAYKCAFTESLRKVYSVETVNAADSLACGVLGLGEIITVKESEENKAPASTHTLQNEGLGACIKAQGNNASEKKHAENKSIDADSVLSKAALSQSWHDLPQHRSEKPSTAEGNINSRENWVTPSRIALGSAFMGFCVIAGLSIKPGMGIGSLSCSRVAAKASALSTNTSEFRSLVLDNKTRCMDDDSFLSQYYRDREGVAMDCIVRVDGSCLYKKHP